jgi:hypothetical protein
MPQALHTLYDKIESSVCQLEHNNNTTTDIVSYYEIINLLIHAVCIKTMLHTNLQMYVHLCIISCNTQIFDLIARDRKMDFGL